MNGFLRTGKLLVLVCLVSSVFLVPFAPVASARTGPSVGMIRVNSSCCTSLYQVAYDAANHYVYVGFSNTTAHGLAVIDPLTDGVVKYISVGTQYTAPYYVAFDPANQDIYVSSEEDSMVYVVSGQSNTVVASLVLHLVIGGTPYISTPFLLSYDGSTHDMLVFIGTTIGQTTFVNTTTIDSRTNAQGTTVDPITYPVYDPLNRLLYGDIDYSNNGIPVCCYVAQINPTTLQTMKLIPVAKNVDANLGPLVLDPYSRVIYGTNIFNHEVFAVNTTDGKLIKTLDISSCGPGNYCDLFSLAFDSANRVLYLPDSSDRGTLGTVALISTRTNGILGSLPLGSQVYPDGFGSALYAPNSRQVYVANYTNTIFTISSG